MSNTEMWAIIVGAALPGVLSVIIQSSWSSHVKSFLAFVASVIAGFGTVYFKGDLVFGHNTLPTASSVLLVVITAFSTYHSAWKPSGAGQAIESATNLPAVNINISRSQGSKPQ